MAKTDELKSVAGSSSDQAIHLAADEMTFDKEKKVVTAQGNVEIGYGARRLSADEVRYDQNLDVVTATGHVVLVEPGQETIFGNTMRISGDLKDAVIENIGVILQDKSRIAGAGARRSGGRITEMRKAAYSPCNSCKKNPSAPPLWQIKAVRVIHDKNAKTVEYRDAWLEFFGYPVVYTPYFRHPDPTVKRKSGILFPTFGNSSDFGATLEIPYFWNISPHEDATIWTRVMANEAPLMSVEYRKRKLKGDLNFSGSVTDNSGSDFETEDGSFGIRGHIIGKGRFDLDDTWRWGFDAERSTDDTYMRRFGFSSPQSLDSQLFVEGFRRRTYFSARTLAFQNLSANTNQEEVPFVLPLVDYSHLTHRDRLGGRTALDINLLALTRDKGTDTRRLSIHPKWQREFYTKAGEIYQFTAGVDTDLYHVNSLDRGQKEEFSGASYRVSPYTALAWRMPFIKASSSISQTIEPIVSLVWRPYGGNHSNIPNEDSTELEFDETNLFSVNRFSGFDRVEGGPRINYGLRWDVSGKKGGYTNIFLGQSYRFKADGTFNPGTGLEDNFSDLVGRVDVSPGAHFNMLYRTRFSSEDFSPTRNEVQLNAGVPAFTVAGNYVFLDQQDGSEFSGREELTVSASSQVNKFWRASIDAIRDMESSDMRSIGMKLTYENECVVFTSRLTRTFFEDRDLKPTDALTFHLILKTIGEAQTGFSRTGAN